MDNRDYNAPEENRNTRPVYETAEEYNKAMAQQRQESADSQYAYNQSDSSETDYGTLYNNGADTGNYQNTSYNSGVNGNNYQNTPYSNPVNNGANGNNYYGGSYYNNGGYNNVNGVVLDSNGKPLKNRFGLQLTFSIIEIVCCCCFGCITMILGIVGCVFACLANKDYKEGRYDSFKSKSLVSTIVLIVGAVFAAISIITSFGSVFSGGFWDEFNTEFEKALEDELGVDVNMDTFWEDYLNGDFDAIIEGGSNYDDDNYEYNEHAVHDNFEDFNEIIVDGVTVSLPCTYADLQAAGFFINQTDLDSTLGAYSDEFYELNTSEKTYIADVLFVNPTGEACRVEEGMVIYLAFYYESAAETQIFDSYEFVNGLDVFNNVEETKDILGEPNYIEKNDTDYGEEEIYGWEYEQTDGYDSYVYITFYDDVMYCIEINNGPDEY